METILKTAEQLHRQNLTNMSLYSTRNHNLRASWRQAVLSGIAGDGGLYLPVELPFFSADKLAALAALSFPDLAIILARSFIGSEVSEEVIESICYDAFNFPLPLKQITEQLQILELFHGPTCAFKDFGARFMARLFRHFWGSQDRQLTVVVATSGDTGSAVANAFLDTTPNPAIRVVILYPKGKVSEIQRKQMTTLGYNVSAFQVDGTFDDCQALAKQALCDQALLQHTPLTSANSINIARLLPQMFYYAYSVLRFSRESPPVFSIPSGNLGNLTGAVLAHLVGFGSKHLIAACNSNDTFPRFLASGAFTPKRSVETISNAMDVGDPSNFARIAALLSEHDKERSIHHLISATAVNDRETRETMRSFYSSYGYVLDPHTAVGAQALLRYDSDRSTPKILVSTAHPAKFSAVVHDVLGIAPQIPQSLESVLAKPEHYIDLPNSYPDFADSIRHVPSVRP
jgi:threonine synthase